MFYKTYSKPAPERLYSISYLFIIFLPKVDGHIFSFMFCLLRPAMAEWVIIKGLD